MPNEDINLDDRESDFNLNKATENVVFRPNHQLMAKTKLRERDLMPQLIYFYQDTRYIPEIKINVYNEGDAAFMEKSSHRFFLHPLGCSDGKTYTKTIRGCGVKSGEIIPRERANQILKDAFDAELKAAKKHGYNKPQDQNVKFDNSFPVDQRASFVPPA